MLKWYALDEKNNLVPLPIDITRPESFEIPRNKCTWKRVAETFIPGYWISTCFLGLDHNYGEWEPLVFETMVFSDPGNDSDLDMERYSTWEQAEKGHKDMVEKWSKRKWDEL